jgi:hypothetical protein
VSHESPQFISAELPHVVQDLLAAVDRTKHGITVTSAHRRRPGSFAGRLAGCIVPSLSTNRTEWIAAMTPVDRHAELVYAESLYQKVGHHFGWPGALLDRVSDELYRVLAGLADAAAGSSRYCVFG